MRYIITLSALFGFAAECLAAATCTASAPAMSFGPYDPFVASAPIQTLGNVSVTCSRPILDPDTTVNYTAVIGTGTSGNYTTRTLRSGARVLNYQLYQTFGITSPWGSAGVVGRIDLPFFFARTRTNTHTVYGQIASRQTATVPGTYSDSLVFTVTYD